MENKKYSNTGCLIKVSEIPKQVDLWLHSAVHYNNQIILFGGRNMNR